MIFFKLKVKNILRQKILLRLISDNVNKADMRQLQMFQKVEYGGGPISKWFQSVKKGVLNLFLSISMAYNVISCQKVAENTQILKIAKFAM